MGQSSKDGGLGKEQVWSVATDSNVNVNGKIYDEVANLKISVTTDIISSMKDMPQDSPAVVTSSPTASPEVIIPDDNIINTQESVDLEMEMCEKEDVDVPVVIPEAKNAPSKMKNKPQAQERRRSERLKKDAHLSTVEKVENNAVKKNLEGKPSSSNSFSVLSVEEVVDISASMGVIIEENDYATCDILKELESARFDLYQNNLINK